MHFNSTVILVLKWINQFGICGEAKQNHWGLIQSFSSFKTKSVTTEPLPYGSPVNNISSIGASLGGPLKTFRCSGELYLTAKQCVETPLSHSYSSICFRALMEMALIWLTLPRSHLRLGLNVMLLCFKGIICSRYLMLCVHIGVFWQKGSPCFPALDAWWVCH